MNDQTQTLIRAVLKIGGGYMVAKGIADQNTATLLTASAASLIGVVWGLYHRSGGNGSNTGTGGVGGATAIVFLAVLAGTAFFSTGCAHFAANQERVETN